MVTVCDHVGIDKTASLKKHENMTASHAEWRGYGIVIIMKDSR